MSDFKHKATPSFVIRANNHLTIPLSDSKDPCSGPASAYSITVKVLKEA